MTLSDWFHPRMDGTLHWQQSLAITVVWVMIAGPGYLWWTYDAEPKSAATDAVTWVLGPESGFRTVRVLNHLSLHTDVFPQAIAANALICGTARVDGRREAVAVLAKRRNRGFLRDLSVLTQSRVAAGRYPGHATAVLDWCEREVRARSA